MEEKGPKATEPKADQSGSPDTDDAALGPEEIARQLFASYLEPETVQLELAPLPEGEEQPEPVELPDGLVSDASGEPASEDQEDHEPAAKGEAEEPEEGGR